MRCWETTFQAGERIEGDETMSTQHTFGGLARDSGPLTSQGATRITGKLLATQGYVVGIEISGSGSRQSVALADLQGKILYRARRPLEYVPDTGTVLNLIDEMFLDCFGVLDLQDVVRVDGTVRKRFAHDHAVAFIHDEVLPVERTISQ